MQALPGIRDDHKLDLAAEVLRSSGALHLKAWGMSMLPSIYPGDLLTIQNAHQEDIVPGDIVLVRRDNRFFVHRLAEKRYHQGVLQWITRGDAMPHNDPPATGSELLGRVSSIRRNHRIIVPSRRASLLTSALAWMLCRSDSVRSAALRIHSFWQERESAAAAPVSRAIHHDECQPHGCI